MQTRTRNALILGVGFAALAAGLTWVAQNRTVADLRSRAIDAIPNGALLVATVDLDACRALPACSSLLGRGREIPGLGKVREVCGLDPMDTLHELAVAIPAAGEEGDFGLVAAGDVPEEALLTCAAKVIEARGGRPIVTTVGSFRTVRDATLAATGGEIAVRKGGPVLLGAGAYLRAMIDAADGRTPTIRSSVAHSHLAREIGGPSLRVTVVLTPEQRRTLDAELRGGGAGSAAGDPRDKPAASSILAGALGVEFGPTVAVHGVILCDSEAGCAGLASSLRASRDARANDFATRLVGFGAVLERVKIESEGELVHARVDVPADEAIALVERLITLRGTRHPMPGPGSIGQPGAATALPGGGAPGAPGVPAMPAVPAVPDEVITADAGAPDASAAPDRKKEERADGGAPRDGGRAPRE